jgi:amidase
VTASLPVDSVNAFVAEPSVLVAGAGRGALADVRLAVKDVLDVAGVVTTACVPEFAARRQPAVESAAAVATLADAGATVVGKTVTDQLAYALTGTTMPSGPPTNVRAPGRITGGSSAGSAAAVAAGLVELAFGTDTGGSIRVPSSYCGIVGWRPTHGRVDVRGMVHLARSFDTVGLLARDISLIETAADLLLDDDRAPAIESASWVSELDDRVEPGTLASLTGALPAPTTSVGIDLTRAAGAFRAIQGREAWREHGAFIESAHPVLDPGVAERFATASRVTDDEVEDARAVRAEVARVVGDATAGGTVLLGPATPAGAPALGSPDTARARALELTCLAGLAGAPVVVLPLARDGDLPIGIACLAAPGGDRTLLRWCSSVLARAS